MLPYLVWFKEPTGGDCHSSLLFFVLFVITVRREETNKKKIDGLGKSLWSSIEVGAQQEKKKPYS